MGKSRQHRLNPSKLLVLLLYGTYPYLDVEEVSPIYKRLTLNIGKFARLMRVKNIHIVEYLEWLESMGYLTIVGPVDKHISVMISVPTLFVREDI